MIIINDFSDLFLSELKRVCVDSPFGARIDALYDAYNKQRYSFIEFWLEKQNEKTTAAFCRYYDAVIFCGEGSDEASDFIKLLSPCSVLYDKDSLLNITRMKRSEGETMQYFPEKCIYSPTLDDKYILYRSGGDMKPLKDVYNLLQSSFPNEQIGSFDDFFVDISHRVRHNSAEVYAIYYNNTLVSTLTVTAKTDTVAVIGSIATFDEYRCKGIAGALLSNISEQHFKEGRKVFLHRKEKILLYERCGFEVVGKWIETVR